MFGRLFQRFQQRVEGAGGKHVNFVDDVDFVACRGRAVAHGIDDFANVVHAGPAGSVHFQHVDVTPFHDADTVFALPAGLCCGGALPIRTNTIHPLGDDPCGGGFASAANTGHDKGLSNTISLKRVFQRAHHGILPHQIGEGFRAVLTRKDAVFRRRGVSHWVLSGWDSRGSVEVKPAGGQRLPRCVDLARVCAAEKGYKYNAREAGFDGKLNVVTIVRWESCGYGVFQEVQISKTDAARAVCAVGPGD